MKLLLILLSAFFVSFSYAQQNDSIVSFPDVEAEFEGGAEGMKAYLIENTEYPELARKKGEEGKVYVKFIIELDGSITGIKVLKSSGSKLLDEEAVRVIENMPNWIPAEKDGKKVRSVCRVPINFTLSNSKKDKKKKKRRQRRMK
ncbi:MAG: energy transducer TonB [Salegentibacter mishustinae]|nr:energy transducer TonB [Salegentibacter mishustinae]